MRAGLIFGVLNAHKTGGQIVQFHPREGLKTGLFFRTSRESN